MKTFLTLAKVALVSFFATSCGHSFYNRSSSKGGMVEQGGSQFVNPFAGMVNLQIGGALVTGFQGGGGYYAPSYRGGGYCPPSGYYPQQSGYRPQPGYGRPPQQCPSGYRPTGYSPGYGGQYQQYGRSRGPYYGSAGNGIVTGSADGTMVEYSDQFLGGRIISQPR